MCTYYWCDYPGQLIANMIHCMNLDGAKEASSTWCSLRDKIIVAIGIDKSDKDLVRTVHMCNRQKMELGITRSSDWMLGGFSVSFGTVVEVYLRV